MNPKELSRMFAELIKKEKGKAASLEVSQSTSITPPTTKALPPTSLVPTVAVKSGEESPAKRRKTRGSSAKSLKHLFPADLERLKTAVQGSTDSKMIELEKRIALFEGETDKMLKIWPETLSFAARWMGYLWGVPFVLSQEQMNFYEELWYSRYCGGIRLGYGNLDAVDIHVLRDDSSRRPHPELSRFHTASLPSQSLDVEGAERPVDTLVDFLSAGRALGAAESATEGASKRLCTGGEAGDATAPISSLREKSPGSLAADEGSNLDVDYGSPEHSDGIRQAQHDNAGARAEEPIEGVQRADQAADVSKGYPSEAVLEGQDRGQSRNLDVGAVTASKAMIPLLAEGEDPGRPAGGEMLTVTPTQPTLSHIFTGAQTINMTVAELETFAERVIEKLSNNWSLDAYKKKMDDCVKRTHENKDAIGEVAKSIAELEETMKVLQRTVTDLGECSTGQDITTGKLRNDIEESVVSHNMLIAQVTSLHEITDKLAAEATCHELEVQKMVVENTSKWVRHEVDHGVVNARLGSLEELRRLDNINRGQVNIAELNNEKMDGFQLCLELQIANGTFPRQLLSNKAFMNFVKDKDRLLFMMATKDSQIS